MYEELRTKEPLMKPVVLKGTGFSPYVDPAK